MLIWIRSVSVGDSIGRRNDSGERTSADAVPEKYDSVTKGNAEREFV